MSQHDRYVLDRNPVFTYLWRCQWYATAEQAGQPPRPHFISTCHYHSSVPSEYFKQILLIFNVSIVLHIQRDLGHGPVSQRIM